MRTCACTHVQSYAPMLPVARTSFQSHAPVICTYALVRRGCASPSCVCGRWCCHAGCSWWAHSKCCSSSLGHQLHFDTEERTLSATGEVLHPAVTTVTYLSVGGLRRPRGIAYVHAMCMYERSCRPAYVWARVRACPCACACLRTPANCCDRVSSLSLFCRVHLRSAVLDACLIANHHI